MKTAVVDNLRNLDWEPDGDPDDTMPVIADRVNAGDQVRLEGSPEIYYAALYNVLGERLILQSKKCKVVVDREDIRLRIVQRRREELWTAINLDWEPDDETAR